MDVDVHFISLFYEIFGEFGQFKKNMALLC